MPWAASDSTVFPSGQINTEVIIPKEPEIIFILILCTMIKIFEFDLTIALSNGVRLNVTVVVLASPDKATLGLHGVGNHVINESVLVPDALGLVL